MHSSLTTPGRRASASLRHPAAAREAERGPAPAGHGEGCVAHADPRAPTGRPDAGLQRWSSREWQAVRHAVYRTLLDMTVFPALSREGVPLPNALRHTAVGHGLIERTTDQPTERLLWLNPGLRRPGAPPSPPVGPPASRPDCDRELA